MRIILWHTCKPQHRSNYHLMRYCRKPIRMPTQQGRFWFAVEAWLGTNIKAFNWKVYFFTGTTKLAGYSRCLSVIASVIPKSRKTALATIFPPMELGTDAKPVLPSSVVQFSTKLSSLLLISGELGISASIAIRLLLIWQVPELPSLNDIDIGTNASLVIDAQPVSKTNIDVVMRCFILGFRFMKMPCLIC